jgi:hypothetical protein
VDGAVHITWQEISRDGHRNRVASRDPETRAWSEQIWLSTGVDNHARTVIVADHDGLPHAIPGGHGTPIYSRSSLRPHDSTQLGEPQQICGNATYPVIRCDRENALFLAMRGPGTTGATIRRSDTPAPGTGGATGNALTAARLTRPGALRRGRVQSLGACRGAPSCLASQHRGLEALI